MPELRHPNLPDQPIHVHEDAVAVHELAGWVRTDTDEPAEPASSEPVENDPLDLAKEN